MNSIEVKGVSKNFGKVRALDNICLRLEENRIYGLLGRNGAGKTTLLNVITGRVFADSGEVLIDGAPAPENDKALRKVYLTSEKNLFPESMKVRDVFRWTQVFYPDFDPDYAEMAAQQFELNTGKKVRTLSTGYNSILKLILALSVNVPYLLFDEPVLGLDANNRDLFYRLLLEKYGSRPCTVVLSTHLIEEISSVIEDIVIIKNGSIIRNESREAFLSQGFAVSGTAQKVDEFIECRNVIGVDTFGGLKTAYILGGDASSVPEGLELSVLDLQKLFIMLTNS